MLKPVYHRGDTSSAWRRWTTRALCTAALMLVTWSSLGAVSRASLRAERHDRVGPEAGFQDFANRSDVLRDATWTQEERTVSANGLRRRLASLQTTAIRADGARVTRLGPKGYGGRTLRLPGNVMVLTHDELRTRSTLHRSHPTTGLARRPTRGCAAETGDEVILGVERLMDVEVVKIVSAQRTTWYALEFGCVALRQVVAHPDGSVSRTELTEFSPGEPAAKLFEVPEDYREGPPSALEAALRQSEPCSPACQKAQENYFRMHDAEYWKTRVP